MNNSLPAFYPLLLQFARVCEGFRRKCGLTNDEVERHFSVSVVSASQFYAVMLFYIFSILFSVIFIPFSILIYCSVAVE